PLLADGPRGGDARPLGPLPPRDPGADPLATGRAGSRTRHAGVARRERGAPALRGLDPRRRQRVSSDGGSDRGPAMAVADGVRGPARSPTQRTSGTARPRRVIAAAVCGISTTS